MMDSILLISIAVIFLAAFVGTIIRYRTRDKCLKEFRGHFVTTEFKDGKAVWGRVGLYHNGFELVYNAPYLDPDGSHYETSYLVYQDQFPNLLMLRRLHDELTPENRKRRQAEVRRAYHPNLLRRIGRRLRNFFNLMRDAFSQAFSTIIAQSKRGGAGNLISTQEGRINQTVQTIIGAGAASYEPMLEKYIGRKVVLEIPKGGQVVEYCGILKEYTAAFLCVLDIPVTEEHEFNLANSSQLEVNTNLDFEIAPDLREYTENDVLKVDLGMKIHNKGARDVEVCHAEGANYSQRVDLRIAAGEVSEFVLKGIPLPRIKPVEPLPEIDARLVGKPSVDPASPGFPIPQVRLWIKARRWMDIVVPRPLGVIRHGAEGVGGFSIQVLFEKAQKVVRIPNGLRRGRAADL